MALRCFHLVPRLGLDLGGAAGGDGRSCLHRAWRRGVGVCLFMVVASFSFFLVSSPHRASITILTHRSPEYILDLLMMPSNTTSSAPPPPSSPSSPSSQPSPSLLSPSPKDSQASFGIPKGFLVHSPSCSIPDLDPLHHSIRRFVSLPKPVQCKGPPAFTSSRGTTLHLHLDVLRKHFAVMQKIYWEKMTTTSTTTSSSTTTTTTTTSTTTHKPPSTSNIITITNITTSTTSVIPPSQAPSTKPSSPPSPSSTLSPAAQRDRLMVDADAVKCCYKGIHRVEQTREKAGGSADGRWKYNNACQPFNASGTEVQEDAALVLCSIGKVVVYKNVHYFFRMKEKFLAPTTPAGGTGTKPLGTPDASPDRNASEVYVEESTKVPPSKNQTKNESASSSSTSKPSAAPIATENLKRVEGAEKLSVIFIGTDSASRLNMMRQMPKTYDFLTKRLGALDLQGFNKVGDNTFPNLMAHLGGYTLEEIDKNNPCMTKSRHHDDCRWIWKDFKRSGYVTAYVEDAPWMGTFHYLRRGFIAQPTDFYGRPFFLASEKEIGGPNKGGHMCQGPNLSIKVVQNYSLEFARAFLGTPTFGFFWSASLSHDHLNMLHHAEEAYLRYLKELEDMGALNHTALFFVSDHGMRWGNLRSTYIGMLEERLPYVIIYLPPWFRKKYDKAYANLVNNTHRLTSNFDVHETLLDLAYGRFADPDYVNSAPSKTKRGIGLFRTVPWNRTCAEAAVPPHFCACQNTLEVPKNDARLRPAATFLKNSLNDQLRPYPQCEQFSKVEVLSARVFLTGKELKPKEQKSEVRTYLLQATLSPGRVAVEASLRHSQQDNSFTMLGSVSRINKYGGTSGCIKHDLLRMYCYCRDQKKAQRLFQENVKSQDGAEAVKRRRRKRNAA